MPTAKKKAKIQASDVVVGTRTLESVLLGLAEQVKANDERCARAEEQAALALKTIAAVTQDLRAITQEMREANQEMREFNRKTDARLVALEDRAAG